MLNKFIISTGQSPQPEMDAFQDDNAKGLITAEPNKHATEAGAGSIIALQIV